MFKGVINYYIWLAMRNLQQCWEKRIRTICRIGVLTWKIYPRLFLFSLFYWNSSSYANEKKNITNNTSSAQTLSIPTNALIIKIRWPQKDRITIFFVYIYFSSRCHYYWCCCCCCCCRCCPLSLQKIDRVKERERVLCQRLSATPIWEAKMVTNHGDSAA